MCKFKVGDKVKTRDGQDVEIVCVDERSKLPIIGLVFWKDGEVTSVAWYEDGCFSKGRSDDNLDITHSSRTVALYQAVILTSSGFYFTPSALFRGLDDDELKAWDTGPYKVVRLFTEYPIEVEQ